MIKKFTLLLLMVFVTIACYADKVTIADFSLSDNWSTDGTYVSYNTSTHVITSTKEYAGYLQNWCEGSGYKASKLTLTTESEAGLKIEVYYTTGTSNTSSIIANATSFELALDATRVIQKIMIQTTGIESGIKLTSVKLELDVTKVNLALFDAGTDVTWNTGTLSATFPGSWGTNYIQDWSNLNGKYATKLVVTTAGAANYQIDGKYTDETNITASRIYGATKCEVTLDPTKAIHWVKITCTNDAGESVIFTDAYLVPTYLSEATTPSLTDGSKAPVVLYRTLKAGWNTICLPFDVASVSTAFGANYAAYAFTAKDGDNLTFSPTVAMTANTPYLIFNSGSQESDFSFTDVTISGAGAGNTSTYDGIAFYGNYTAGMSMNGKLGLVNEGSGINQSSIQKGKSSATLKAFGAYFNGTIGTRGFFGIETDDGTTSIKSVNRIEEGDGIMYGLDGKRLTNPKGLYIMNGKKYFAK